MKRAYQVVFEKYHRPSGTVVELHTYVERDNDEPYDEESVVQQAYDIAKDIVGGGIETHFRLDAIHEVVG